MLLSGKNSKQDLIDMLTQHLFPSIIFQTNIQEDTSIISIDDWEMEDSGAPSQNDMASISHRVLERYPDIKKLFLNKFKQAAKDVLRLPHDFMITTSWFSGMKKGDFTRYHKHQNSFYSGVYYFGEYDENSGQLLFYTPLIEGLQSFYVDLPNGGDINSTYSWMIPPEKNKLVFFPSYLDHMMTDHHSDLPRYSLAFNIIPIGRYGAGDSLFDTAWLNE
jgi:uncharacterized protein (TIGR02466 family)|tara:strand:+ start:329 stop:985 length:657 start_codon:yes stop_codon:yes gene_type:complete